LAAKSTAPASDVDISDEGGWDEDIVPSSQNQAGSEELNGENPAAAAAAEEEGGEWDLGDDIDVPKPAASTAAPKKLISLPPEGASWPSLWCINSELAADHIAAGSFETAIQLLAQQIGLANPKPMKQHFMRIYSGAGAQLLMQPSTPASTSYLLRNPAAAAQRDGLPMLALPINELIERLQLGYRATTGGKFQEALEHFKWIFSAIPLVCAQSSQELAEVSELVGISKDYCLGLQTELKRKGT